jgi:leucyl/phenylalanyl-tRNA--protein transferase
MIPWLPEESGEFPPLDAALTEPNGLLAAGGDLDRQRAFLPPTGEASFPGFRPGEPILWWSPDPRMVLIPGEFKICVARWPRPCAIRVL